MKILFKYLLAVSCAIILSSCGDTGVTKTHSGTIKAVIKPTELTASLNVGGVQMAINLPPGVTPAKNPEGRWDYLSLIEFVSQSPPAYQVHKATYDPVQSVVEFSVIDLAGFSTNDQINLHLIVIPGANPQESDFSIKSYMFFDKDTGVNIPLLKPTLTTTIY